MQRQSAAFVGNLNVILNSNSLISDSFKKYYCESSKKLAVVTFFRVTAKCEM